MDPLRGEVSGAYATAAAASSTSTMCTAKLSRRGCGAYWTSRPDNSGPIPSAPMLETVATEAARVCQRGGAASMTAAVAVPANRPAENPDSTRPTSRTATESANRNTTPLATANATPANSTGRRPMASDHRPNTTSVNSTPPA